MILLVRFHFPPPQPDPPVRRTLLLPLMTAFSIVVFFNRAWPFMLTMHCMCFGLVVLGSSSLSNVT
jgi:hypothetical protein